MDLFIVVRWGTDDDVNGPDTLYLVRADGYQDAVHLAETALKALPHRRVTRCANVCVKVGLAEGDSVESAILLGPCYQFWRNLNGFTGWLRHDPDQPWKSLADGP